MKVQLFADGRLDVDAAPIICHNERLADPLDSLTRHFQSISGKRKKTEADHEEMAHIEFLGGLYLSEPNYVTDGEIITPAGAVPVVPGWNILRCLQEGAKRHKRGPDVLRGIHPLAENAPLIYDGPTEPEEMWKVGKFHIRKGVGVSSRRIMRTRPIFQEWTLTLPVEVDPIVLDIDTVATFWADAGRYAGLGDMRPIYGRFKGTVIESKPAPKKGAKK